ncbi:hypothetical protein WR25_25369 isoform E [Diploscapter pachys]|uniref:Uncharacterized protein n=1 Tax=Diploscapter pachys TaxID=2018661 RepID=A0A2A2JRU7_9BILA|nr:hypothetical protein WR25_25369 isoform E [Diploscapter pachys]
MKYPSSLSQQLLRTRPDSPMFFSRAFLLPPPPPAEFEGGSPMFDRKNWWLHSKRPLETIDETKFLDDPELVVPPYQEGQFQATNQIAMKRPGGKRPDRKIRPRPGQGKNQGNKPRFGAQRPRPDNNQLPAIRQGGNIDQE